MTRETTHRNAPKNEAHLQHIMGKDKPTQWECQAPHFGENPPRRKTTIQAQWILLPRKRKTTARNAKNNKTETGENNYKKEYRANAPQNTETT